MPDRPTDRASRLIAPLAKATARAGASAELGGFGALFDLKATGLNDPVLVAAADGVGTKVKVAIETGRHDTIGLDLVALCVNDLVVRGAEPLFFMDYFSCGALDPEIAASVVSGIAEGCRDAGAALIGGETAEVQGLYAPGDYDIAGFAVGAVERERLLPRTDLAEDDVLLGLPAQGVHSNGFSLVRRIVREEKLTWSDAAPFMPGETLGSAFLRPTRIYAKQILAALRETDGIKALAHVAGGGLAEAAPRMLPEGFAAEITLYTTPVPPVFRWLAATGKVSQEAMLRTFNCGIGMVVAVAPEAVQEVAEALAAHGEAAVKIGCVVKSESKDVQFKGSLGL